MTMLQRLPLALAAPAAALLLAGCEAGDGAPGTDGQAESAQHDDAQEEPRDDASGEDAGEAVTTTIRDVDGQELGTVVLTSEADDTVVVEADLEGVEDAGFHGFHIHEAGECDPDDPEGAFSSAGGHFDLDGDDHGAHAGDLAPLLVTGDGRAHLAVRTDRFTLDELTAEEGTAIIVHEDPDNLGHVPDRYLAEGEEAGGPDQDTRDTGDAGDRIACGVVGEDEDGG
jgi:superoxide dismutase, Cu-Zn family